MRYCLWLVLVCALAASGDGRRAAGADPVGTSVGDNPQVSVTPLDDRVRVLLDGQPFAEYVFQGYSRPIVYPILGPHSLGMTRNWPMREDVAGESHDHPHQKALFVGFGAVNGVDFFSEFPGAGKIVHRELLNAESGTQRGWLKATNDWVASDGQVICSDTRLLAFQAVPGGRAIDVEITLHASHGDVKFTDDKHGLLAIRMHPNLQLDNDPAAGVTTANGQVVNSEGVRGAAVFGKRARWIDYWGKIDGHTVGIAMFDHPSNPRHPTWWMARGYGYCAADPFGGNSIGGEPPGTGDLTIPAGASATFRYRVVFHEGDPDQAKMDELYRSYADRMTRAVSQFHRGAALLEQYHCQEAAEAFEETLRLFPQWTAARFNLGLACLSNRSVDLSKTLDRAREAFEQVLMAEPNHLHARYCLGVILGGTRLERGNQDVSGRPGP